MKRLLLCVALLLTALTAESHAQWWGGGYGYGNYYNRGIYVDQDRIPYFSLHPPVYYSYPVPRTYGYSPFAYPGYIQTPMFQTHEPAVMMNPYVTPGATSPREPASPSDAPPFKPQKTGMPLRNGSTKDQVGDAKPLRISNPFVGTQQFAAGR